MSSLGGYLHLLHSPMHSSKYLPAFAKNDTLKETALVEVEEGNPDSFGELIPFYLEDSRVSEDES